MRNTECTETREGHRFALLEFSGNGADESLERFSGCTLRDAGALGNEIDEVLLGHKRGGNEVET